MTAIADARVEQQVNTIPTLSPGLGEDIDVLLAMSKKLDALAKPVQENTVAPARAFDTQIIDLLGKIEKNTSLLLKRGIPATTKAQAQSAKEAPPSTSVQFSAQRRGLHPTQETGKAETAPKKETKEQKPQKEKKAKAEPAKAPTQTKAPQKPGSRKAEPAKKPAQVEKVGTVKKEQTKQAKAEAPERTASKTAQAAPAKPQSTAPTAPPPAPGAEKIPQSVSRSAQAREEQRQKKSQAELKKGITESLKDGLVTAGAKTLGKAGEIAKGETAQDAIGTAIGGPIYSAAKEMHGAAKDILDVDPGSMTGKALEKIKGKFGKEKPEAPVKKGGPTRDERGRFLTKEERETKELEGLTKEFDTLSQEKTKPKKLTKEVKEIRTDLERNIRVNRKFQRDTDRVEDEQVAQAEALFEGTDETHDILEDNEDRERKRDRRLIRVIMRSGMGDDRGPGLPRRRRGGGRGGGDKGSKKKRGDKGSKRERSGKGRGRTTPQRRFRSGGLKKTGMLGKLGKLGRLGRIGKIAGLLGGGAGLLGGVGSFVGGGLFGGREDQPDITDQAVDAAETKRAVDAKKVEPEPETKAKAKVEPETKAKAKVEPETKAKAKAEPETKAKAKAEPETKAKVRPETKAKAKVEPETKAKAKVELETKGKAKVKPETKTKAKAEPETKAKKPKKVAKPLKAKSKKPAIAKKLSVGKFNKAGIQEGTEAIGKRGTRKATAKVGTKLGTKAALRMGGKLAGGALRAVPVVGQIASIGLGAMDAYQGWNDREMQAQAFGLKEGQKATTGQKASTATANVLDMGGLGTGLLNMAGVDVNTADIAKKVHEVGSVVTDVVTNPVKAVSGMLSGWFGGDEDKQTKEQAKVETHKSKSKSLPTLNAKETAEALEKEKVIDLDWIGASEIKNWKAIEKLPYNKINALIRYKDWSEEDDARLKKLYEKKKKEYESSGVEQAKATTKSKEETKEQAKAKEKTTDIITSPAKAAKEQEKVKREAFPKPSAPMLISQDVSGPPGKTSTVPFPGETPSSMPNAIQEHTPSIPGIFGATPAPPGKITHVPMPRSPMPAVTAMEQQYPQQAIGEDGYPPRQAKASNRYQSRMIRLLEEIAGQGKNKPVKDGRFKKPDSVIPTEFDDTVLTLMAHDRL